VAAFVSQNVESTSAFVTSKFQAGSGTDCLSAEHSFYSRPQMYRVTWGKWSIALDWLQWARSMGHPSSLSGKVHKGEAITAMSILAVLCEVSPPAIIETLANFAAPLSVQAFLRGDDAILVSHSLPCLAAMATVPILANILDKVDCSRTISKSLPPFSSCFRLRFRLRFWFRV
jgi:hypothetical protein